MKDIRKLKCWNKLKEMGFIPTIYKFHGKTTAIGASLFAEGNVPIRVVVDIVPYDYWTGYRVVVDQYYYPVPERIKQDIETILTSRNL